MKWRGLPRDAASTRLPAWCQAQRRAQGRRHALCTVLAIATGAILCGMRAYKAIADWAQSLGPKARQRFRCRHEKGRYWVPSESIIRDVLVRVEPTHLDRAFKRGKPRLN
jgi:hypothetical protein